MRLKGINPFEQHVEKIVAGVFGLALLAVLAMQFLSKPALVKVGNAEVPPADAYIKMAQLAKSVDERIKRTPQDLEGLSPAPITKQFDQFEAKIKAPVAPHPQLAAALDSVAAFQLGSANSQNASVPINELVVPAPTRPTAATIMSTVATWEQQNPEVAKVLPAATPFDKASVSVDALFDGTALKSALALDPDGPTGPIRVIPSHWYINGVQILGVELHRQTLKPDGAWGAAEKVKQFPGRTLFVDDADKLNDAAVLNNATKFATDQSEMVRRTPYYAASFGEKWMAPSERETAGLQDADKAARVRAAYAELKRHEADLKRHQDALAKVGQPAAPLPGGGGGGGKGPGGGGGGGRNSPPTSTPTGPNQQDERTKKRIQDEILVDQKNIAKDKATLRELGEQVDGDATPAADPNAKPKQEPPVLDNNSIKVWAHDAFVERGKTYRYQVVLILTNPYFGHSAAMIPAQAEKLAKTGIMRSAASEWTTPITVDPETYLFFTSATDDEPNAGRVASARAEVFQFKWGFWRQGAATLEPGDSVITEIKVPDFAKILAAQPGSDPTNPGGFQPPISIPGGGGRGRTISSPPPTPGNPDVPIIAPGTPPPMINVSVESNQIMLGVGQGSIRDAAGKAKSARQVYIRQPGGDIQIIIPDEQKADPAYKRVVASADKGKKELTPLPEKPKPLQPNQDPNATPPGGGGGAPPPGRGG
jgi:hypothetical protein